MVSDFSTCLRRRNQTDISHSLDMTEVLARVLPHSNPRSGRSFRCRASCPETVCSIECPHCGGWSVRTAYGSQSCGGESAANTVSLLAVFRVFPTLASTVQVAHVTGSRLSPLKLFTTEVHVTLNAMNASVGTY